MAKSTNTQQFNELVLQMIETEQGGEHVYRTAIACAQNDALKNNGKVFRKKRLHVMSLLPG